MARARSWACGLAVALLATLLAGCGGGGGSSGDAPGAMEGTRDTRVLRSRHTGTEYPLSIYLPPASAGPRSGLPVVYVLDGDSWFESLVGIVEFSRTRLIIVGIGSAGRRNVDFVPPNSCTQDGGGQGAYLNFLRQELLPWVESSVGGSPGQRLLFGHSHGGSFVYHALFAEAPGQHSFKAYLASDASISCLPGAAQAWEQTYAAAHRELPVRLHVSYASSGNHDVNLAYAQLIASRRHQGLAMVSQAYTGTHSGIVPQVLVDAIGFAIATAP